MSCFAAKRTLDSSEKQFYMCVPRLLLVGLGTSRGANVIFLFGGFNSPQTPMIGALRATFIVGGTFPPHPPATRAFGPILGAMPPDPHYPAGPNSILDLCFPAGGLQAMAWV